MKKYNWVGNKIDPSDMERLHYLSKQCKKPITQLVREAVKQYLVGKIEVIFILIFVGMNIESIQNFVGFNTIMIMLIEPLLY
jgi:hypothetical protein